MPTVAELLASKAKAAGASVSRLLPSSGVVMPVAGQYRISGGVEAAHRAIDFAAPAGTPVVAARSGYVRIGGGDSAYGNLLRVEDPKTGIESLYAHLSSFAKGIATGTYVRAGQVIGFVGSSGESSGPHLHFEVNPIGPERFAGGRSDVGALDPWAFLKGAGMSNATATAGLAPNPPGKVLTVTKAKTQAKTKAIAPVFGAALGGVGMKATEALRSGLTAQPTSKVEAEDARLFGALGGPKLSEVSSAGRRIGFVAVGFTIIVVGLLILAFSFQDRIGEAVSRAGQVGGTAAKVAVSRV